MPMYLIYKSLEVLENMCARALGKGYGTATINSEISGICKLLKYPEPSVCIDIGGNVGNYTDALAKRFTNARIYTFEPSRTNVETLVKRFSGNPNVTVVPVAVSNVENSTILYADEAGSGLASLTKRRLEHIGKEFEFTEVVKTIRFEDYWKNELNRCEIDLLKLDIEGHELLALEGCGDALSKTDVVQFEFGGCNIDTRTYFRDFWHFFNSGGFSLYRITPFGVMPIKRYSEQEENFTIANFLAVKN